MKRSAFTMIELIFVIVILGILASVAIPKLAGVQDDALVASEKTGISSARSSVESIRGRALSRPGQSITVTVSKNDGTEASLVYDTNSSGANAAGLSTKKYPNGLSVDAGYTTFAFDAAEGSGLALAAVLEPTGREAWATVNDTNVSTRIAGPATIGVTDAAAELNNLGSWNYNPTTGKFLYKAATPF